MRTRNRIARSKPVPNTRRVERTIKLIAFLSEWHSLPEIATHLEIHRKTVLRYLDLLLQLGFEVEQQYKKRLYVRLGNVATIFRIVT